MSNDSNEPEHANVIDPRRADAMRLAKLRQQLYTDANTRQNALATFVLSKAATAGELRRALDVRSMAGPSNNRIDSEELDAYLSQLEFEICSSFREQFGRELFDGPPVYSNVDLELRPMPADHQAAMLRATSDHFATTQPVPGWPMVIKAHTGDNGFFDSMRRNHPVKLDEIVNGKRVVATHWFHCPDEGDQPVYRLEGEEGYRLASDLAGRITRPSNPAPITTLATDESEHVHEIGFVNMPSHLNQIKRSAGDGADNPEHE